MMNTFAIEIPLLDESDWKRAGRVIRRVSHVKFAHLVSNTNYFKITMREEKDWWNNFRNSLFNNIRNGKGWNVTSGCGQWHEEHDVDRLDALNDILHARINDFIENFVDQLLTLVALWKVKNLWR
jgi:hypothetical protein